jgi:hypothetical protein
VLPYTTQAFNEFLLIGRKERRKEGREGEKEGRGLFGSSQMC